MIVTALKTFETPNGITIREGRDYIAVAQKFLTNEDFYIVEIPNHDEECLPQKFFKQKNGVKQPDKFINPKTGLMRLEEKYVA